MFSISIDGGTSKAKRKYVAVTCSGISRLTWQNESFLLGYVPVSKTETAEFLARVVQTTLADWKIPAGKVAAVTTDAGANMVSCVTKQLKLPCIHCAAHMIHLAVMDAVKSSKSIHELSKEQKKCKLFRFPKAIIELAELQRMKGLPVKTIKAYCPTRWGSIFKMLKRMIESRRAIDAYLLTNNYHSLVLTEAMWQTLRDLVDVLHKVSQHLSQQNVSTVGLATRLIEVLLHEHLSVEGPSSPKEGPCIDVVLFKKSLAQGLQTRWTKLQKRMKPKIFQMAVYLDPRSKDHMFIEDDVKRNKLIGETKELAAIYLEKQEADYKRYTQVLRTLAVVFLTDLERAMR